jgi:hypothetical protein
MAETILHRIGRRLRREWRRASSTWATRAESAAVLRLVAASAAAGVPAATMLDAWAEDSRGGQGTRLEKAAGLLRRGATAADAVAAVPGLVQDDHAVALAFGERAGLVGPVVEAALAGDDLLDPGIRRTFRTAVGYLTIVLLVFLVTVSFISLAVNPQLVRIIQEFGGQPSAAFRRWLALVNVVSGLLWLPVVLAAVGAVIRCSPPLRRLVMRPFERPRRQAAAIDLLGVAIAGGVEPDAAARMLADCQVDPVIARRLRAVGPAEPLGRTLASAGLVAPTEASEIDAAGTLSPAVMHAVATARRTRGRRRSLAIGEAIVPAFVMVMGLLVLLQAVAVFSFLTDLIHGLA